MKKYVRITFFLKQQNRNENVLTKTQNIKRIELNAFISLDGLSLL